MVRPQHFALLLAALAGASSAQTSSDPYDYGASEVKRSYQSPALVPPVSTPNYLSRKIASMRSSQGIPQSTTQKLLEPTVKPSSTTGCSAKQMASTGDCGRH